MCFSATASFTAGITLSVIGIATINKTQKRTEIPFATIPILFGLQQFIEGIIWLSFKYQTPLLNEIMTYIYTLFSHILWPIFVPFSIALLEPIHWRKKIEVIFGFIGIAVALYLLYFIVKFPVISLIINKSISYDSPHFYSLIIISVYLMATSVSCFFSSYRLIIIFGILLTLFLIISYYFYAASFFSVWCFFASILSMIIYVFFDRRELKYLNQNSA
jgi:hypothetical protein